MIKWPTIWITVALSITFFVVLSFVGWLQNKLPGIEPIHVFLSLIPFIILLIASGQLKELKGPGGIGLILKEQVDNNISTEYEDKTLEVEEGADYEKASMPALNRMLETNPPTSMSFLIGKKHYYSNGVIENQLQQLLNYPAFRYIVLTDLSRKFLGLIDAQNFKAMMEARTNVVKELETGKILEHPSILNAKIDRSSTNRQALAIMETSNINKLAVVDSNQHFVGIITQDEIVRKILATVIREA